MAENEEQVEERVYTDDETRAMQHGWVPKDQWNGNTDEWIPAQVFNMRGDFFGRIAKDKREISELKTAINTLVDQNRKSYDIGYKEGLAQLRAEKKVALEEGDADKVLAIDDKIDEFKEEHASKKQEFEQKLAVSKQPENPAFDAWHANNDWYLSDQSSTAYANELVIETTKQAQATGVQVDYPKLLQEITRKVKQKFPEKFGRSSTIETTEKKVSGVDSGSDSSGDKSTDKARSTKYSDKGMTEQERSIMNTIIKTTGMTKDEYLAEMHKYEEKRR